MNESRHSIDDLFRKGLEGHTVEPSRELWGRIEKKRTPVYRLMNNLRLNSRRYLVLAGSALLLSVGVWAFLKPDSKQSSWVEEPVSISEDVIGAKENADAVTNTSEFEEANSGFIDDKPLLSAENKLPMAGFKADKTAATMGKGAGNHFNINRNDPSIPHTPIPKEDESLNQVTSETSDPLLIVMADEGVYVVNVTPSEAVDNKPEIVAIDNDLKKEEKKEQVIAAAPPITPSPWSIDLLGSYDFMGRRLDYADANYAHARKESERVANAFSFQLRAGYRLNPMVTLQSGISLSRINETLQYHNSYTETEIIERQETGYILDPINGPTQITYTVSDTVSNSYEVKANGTNRYTFIDIPLLVNYSVYTSNKLTIGLSGGPVFNLAFLQEGRIIHANQREFIDLSSGDNPYRTTAGVNALFNVNAAYRLNRSFDLLFEPGFRMGIASLNREPINMIQRYHGVQLFSGLRYRF